MRVKKSLAAATAAAAALAGVALAAPAQAASQPTLTDLAVSISGGPKAGQPDRNNADFDIAVAALVATGLDKPLDDPRARFTVVLPNDRAFIRSANELIAALNLDIPTIRSEKRALDFYVNTVGLDTVETVLLYHVVAGEKTYHQLRSMGTVEPLLAGTSFEVKTKRVIDGLGRSGWVIAKNVDASNGKVNVITRVILPGLP
jgi:uncharacterized surface protein with fasciclin (FAS1) repeats